MTWIVGIDEAGYGPYLGPFVMTAVACRVVGDKPGCLWELLKSVYRKARGPKKGCERIIVDDSKVVYSSLGLPGLEAGALSILPERPATLVGLASLLCLGGLDELRQEPWFHGATPAGSFDRQGWAAAECARAGVTDWTAFSVVVCPSRFNQMVHRTGTKSVVLADSFVTLLSTVITRCREADIEATVDKQGGRNDYLLQVQQATGALIRVAEEGSESSRYEAALDGRGLTVTFRPRADQGQLCVALASMISKYLREMLMAELNAFWQERVPGLKPTAGYPQDAPRFLQAITPVARELGLPIESIWRVK